MRVNDGKIDKFPGAVGAGVARHTLTILPLFR